ncbi:phosphatidylglycerophosphatase [Gallibacterium genomosp. 3]|uniref:Phosphatidylglycerophosphatase A n=1 Tax=Gallibacterium genomosp. 3 TaxID=505345 RepID=A0A1A7PVB4_9PAST|nr:phosphatidylglycerophosphatase A [Gallibacterium genomosp. 3]OBX05662.1 phosphatidylglycerophosphatase [Gallibacterium genomosp. 3]
MALTTSAKNNHAALQKTKLTNPIHFLALGFGSGLIYPAPGTWGTLAGLITGIILLQWITPPIFLVCTLVAFLLGIYLCGKTAEDMQVHDHGSIVWDEIVAIWLVLSALPDYSWMWYLAAFVLFRLFDILKPMPIRYFDRKLKTGFGIMFDDLLAAVYAILVLLLCQWML